jgi:hypothetical protein
MCRNKTLFELQSRTDHDGSAKRKHGCTFDPQKHEKHCNLKGKPAATNQWYELASQLLLHWWQQFGSGPCAAAAQNPAVAAEASQLFESDHGGQ